MKKQLPTNAITNELSNASVFFQKPAPAPLEQAPGTRTNKSKRAATATPSGNQDENFQVYPKSNATAESETITTLDDVIPRHHATVIPRDHETQSSPKQGPIDETMVEHIRKAVKQFGKEAATHRFTPEEKRVLSDIVYTYERRGYRTSENEITRIAINWLVMDYQQAGEQSVLVRVLDALNG